MSGERRTAPEVAVAALRILRENQRELEFPHQIKWLEEHLSIWRGRAFRVGVLGVTSAGKSTMINRLLNERLLPEKVRPSSNALVICRRGAALRAIVHFQSGVRELVDRDVRARVCQLGDEASNGGNEAGVQEIELESPRFRLSEAIDLVDSPGLDAAKFEKHEKVSLELLLPSVDVVVFVTTAKANQDGLLGGYLTTIAQAGKPLFLVQNAIDSIEPKLGARATEVKSRQEVQREHHARLLRVVEGCPSRPDIRAVVQVSARTGEGFEALIDGLEAEVQALAPELEAGRLRQLEKFALERFPEVGPDGLSARKAALDLREKEMKELVAWFETSLEQARRRAQESLQFLHGAVAQIGASSLDEATRLKRAIDSWGHECFKPLHVMTGEAPHRITTFGHAIGLRGEDISQPLRGEILAPHSSVEIKVEQREVRTQVKQPSLVGSLKRGFGSIFGASDWGYDEHITTERVFNASAFRSQSERVLENSERAFSRSATKVEEHFRPQLRKVGRELEEQLCELESSRSQSAERVTVTLAIRSACGAGRGSTVPKGKPLAPRRVDATPTLAENDNVLDLDVSALRIAQLATLLVRRKFLAARDEVLARGTAGPEMKPILVWGGDSTCLDQFRARFLWDATFEPAEMVPGLLVGQVNGRRLFIIDEVRAEQAKPGSPSSILKKCTEAPAALFLLLDLDQPGSTASRLEDSPIRRLLQHFTPAIAVGQSARGVFPSDERVKVPPPVTNLASSFSALFSFLPSEVQGLIVNDEDLTLSVIADRLWRHRGSVQTIAEEVEWQRDANFVGEAPWVAGLLREFRTERRQSW